MTKVIYHATSWKKEDGNQRKGYSDDAKLIFAVLPASWIYQEPQKYNLESSTFQKFACEYEILTSYKS